MSWYKPKVNYYITLQSTVHKMQQDILYKCLACLNVLFIEIAHMCPYKSYF